MPSWAGSFWTHEQSKSHSDQNHRQIRRTLPIQLFGLLKEFHATDGDSRENSNPPRHSPELQPHNDCRGSSSNSTKTFRELQLCEFWVLFSVFLSPHRYLNLINYNVPPEDLVFQLNSILLLVGRRFLVNPVGRTNTGCAATPGGCGTPNTLTPHHCCTEWPLGQLTPRFYLRHPKISQIIIQTWAKWLEGSRHQDQKNENSFALFSNLSESSCTEIDLMG